MLLLCTAVLCCGVLWSAVLCCAVLCCGPCMVLLLVIMVMAGLFLCELLTEFIRDESANLTWRLTTVFVFWDFNNIPVKLVWEAGL